jgi:hypothetical protein
MREALEKKMTGLLLGLKLGTKTVTDVLPTLNRLKSDYPLIADDYEKKYMGIIVGKKLVA